MKPDTRFGHPKAWFTAMASSMAGDYIVRDSNRDILGFHDGRPRLGGLMPSPSTATAAARLDGAGAGV